MKIALSNLLTAMTLGAGLLLSSSMANADGPYGDYGTEEPAYTEEDPNGQAYQPPPEGTCLDENNQPYDCSNDQDYSAYSQIDDGYDPNAYQDFQGTLAPYGNWINNEQYGQIWAPSQGVVGADFTPYYSGGHWNMTDYGWTWASDYNWGWAPFHYGRWVTVPSHGWCWIPGRIWGPAWVHWRLGGGHVGWAPLPPRGVRIAPPVLGMDVRFHRWNFVPLGHLTAPRLVRIAPPLIHGFYRQTSIVTDLRSINGSRIVYGPPAHHFASASIRINPVPLHTLHACMPRASIVVRAGVPLTARPYYAPVYRNNPGFGRVGTPVRPGYPAPGYPRPVPGYPHPTPGYPQPGYPRPVPGYPHPTPGYPQPGYPRPVPGYPQPHPAPGYPQPGYPRPVPGYPQPHPAPGYPQPGYPQPHPAPGYPQPGYPRPVPGYPQPHPAPGYPQPHPAPGYPQPRPVPGYPQPQPAPGYPRPAPPTFSHPAPSPVYTRPSAPPAYHAPAPPPVYTRPSAPPVYHAPAPPPVYTRPSAPPAYRAPVTTVHAPAPVYHAPPSRPSPAPGGFRR